MRELITVVLPLLLPTALYLLWISTIGAPHEGGALPWAAVPWVWLAAAGTVLLAIVLFVITVGFGTAQQGIYVAPRWLNGKVVPGHIEPQPPR